MNSNASAAARPSRFFGPFCALVTLALLLCRLPYRGVRHDAILYLGQALARVNPTWAAGDFYFVFGSQDRYSLFSWPRAWLLGRVGTPYVDITTIVVAWGVFIWALVAIARDLSPRQRWLGVMAVVAASHFYGCARIFGFMEPFLTARTIAEPLALVALACLLRGSYPLAAAALCGSALFHPLMALPMVAVFFGYLVMGERRWAWLLALFVPAGGLALAGVAPFASMAAVYDHDWWQAVVGINQPVLIGMWRTVDIVASLANLGVLALACRRRTDPLARAGRAALVAALVLGLVSYLGADVLHDVLVTQLQLWRVMWVVDVLALLNLPALLAREWARGPVGRLAAVAVFVAYFVADSYFENSWAIATWAIVALAMSARAIPLKPSIVLAASVGTILVGLVTTGLEAFHTLGQMNMTQQGMAIARMSSIPFVLAVITLPAALLLIMAWERGGQTRGLAVVATAILTVVGVSTWDQRTAWARYVEAAQPGSHPFAKLIPPGTEVYWHEDTLANWVLLQRPQFVSLNQVSGVLFNRNTAYVGISRMPYLLAARGQTNACDAMSQFDADSNQLHMCQLSREGFLGMCRAEPIHPGFLIASVDFGTGVVARWRFAPDDGSPPVTYVLYDCAKIR